MKKVEGQHGMNRNEVDVKVERYADEEKMEENFIPVEGLEDRW